MDIVDLSSTRVEDAQLKRFLHEMCQALELDFAAYANNNTMSDTISAATTYPTTWELHYQSRNLHLNDPVLTHGARSIIPLDWGRLRRDDAFETMFSQAHDFGIPDRGLTVPVRGPYGDMGMLSVSRLCTDDEWRQLKRKIMGDLQQAAVHVHDAVMRSGTLAGALRRPLLSSREAEVLQWAAMGKSQLDIGDILSISQRTVEVHLRSARTKLGALTTTQAVGRGIALRLIEPG